MTTVASCPECGAPVAGREACQRLFDEVIAREFGDYRYGRIHRLTVDAYSLQHPAEYMRSAKSYVAHLTGVYAALETDHVSETNRATQQWLNGVKDIVRPDTPLPGKRGNFSVLHVHVAVDADDHIRRVRAWALSTWRAWAAYHDFARKWVQEALATQVSGPGPQAR